MVSTLVLIYFGRPPLGRVIKANFSSFQTVVPEICSIWIFNNRVLDYNHFYKILSLFDVLPNLLFTTSETMQDYYL